MGFAPLFWLLAGLLMIGSEFLVPGFVIFFSAPVQSQSVC